MAVGDIIIIVSEIIKKKNVDFSSLDAIAGFPSDATSVNVQLIPRDIVGDTVIYDVITTGVAAS